LLISLIEVIHIGSIANIKIEIAGEQAAGVIKIIRKSCIRKELPDFPNLEPIPSIADLPFILSFVDRGINAISLVSSNKVYLHALLNIFCIEPKNTQSINGFIPKIEIEGQKCLKNKNEKNPIPVSIIIKGVIIAAFPHPSLLITLPDIKYEEIVASIPISRVILLM